MVLDPQRGRVLREALREPALVVVLTRHAMSPPLVCQLVGEEEVGQVGEARGIVAERPVQEDGPDGEHDHSRRAVAAGHAGLEQGQRERRVGARPELAGVEAEDGGGGVEARFGRGAQPSHRPRAERDPLRRPVAHLGEAAHHHRDVLARTLLPVLDVRAPRLGAHGGLLPPRERHHAPGDVEVQGGGGVVVG